MDLVLVILEMLYDLIIGFLMAKIQHMPNFRPLGPPHGLKEGPVIHVLGPDHLGEFLQPHHWLPHDQYELHGHFQTIWGAMRALTNSLAD